MAPSDDDDQRVPDAAASDSDPAELPAGPHRRSIGRGQREGVDPRPSGSVVFDVEVDDPSLVMQRPSRRARTKAADRGDDGEIVDGETVDDPAQLGSGDDGDAEADAAADEHDHDNGGDAVDVARPLVSGDPLLTGPTPTVRRSKRGSRAEPAAPPAKPDVDPEPAAGPPTRQQAAPSEPPAVESPVESPPSSAPSGRSDKPPLTPRDLFEPVTGEHRAIPDEPTASVPPPAPPAGQAAGAPPPPPAPSLAGGTPGPGIVRPVPPVSPPPTEPARRASRGSQVTGQTATTVMRPVDQSGPVATQRPTAVAPAPRLAGRRPRVRRVTRVVRHVDPWSVFKVAAVFSFVAYGIALVAGVLLWNVAYATGTVDNIERGLESTGWETFELNGGEIFHNAWIGGLFAAVGLTGLAVLVATLFNLITDLVGGVRMTVLEEEVVEKTGSPMRRFSSRKAPDPVPPPTKRRR